MASDLPEQFTVVLVEDDARLAALIRRYLESHGLIVHHAVDAPTGLRLAVDGNPDVVLLDRRLPGYDGLELCRRLRERSSVPVVMLTAMDGELDRILGLEGGADDYLVKPISSPELLARLRAQVRRARGLVGPRRTVLKVGRLVMDAERYRATLGGKDLPLTVHEFALLRIFAERAGRVLTREQLIELIRGRGSGDSFDRSVDVHVSHLRHKLGDDPKNPAILKTIRGVGYLLVSPE